MRWVIAIAMLAVAMLAADPAAAADDGRDLELRIAWWNDLFGELPLADDSGFTNDFELEAARRVDRLWIGGRVFYRIITEQFGSGDFAIPEDRWDQLDLFATARVDRSWRGFALRGGARAGATIAGRLGGLAIQNSWHRLTGSGATTDQGLQDTYPGGRVVGLVAGGRLAIDRGVGGVRVGLGVDGQLAVGGTGVRSAAGFARAGGEIGSGATRLQLGGELAVATYATADPNLELTGGYGTGDSPLSLRLSIAVRHGAAVFGYQYRGNESGSGEAVGVFWFALAR